MKKIHEKSQVGMRSAPPITVIGGAERRNDKWRLWTTTPKRSGRCIWCCNRFNRRLDVVRHFSSNNVCPPAPVPSARLAHARLTSRGSHCWKGTRSQGGGPQVCRRVVRACSQPQGTFLHFARPLFLYQYNSVCPVSIREFLIDLEHFATTTSPPHYPGSFGK